MRMMLNTAASTLMRRRNSSTMLSSSLSSTTASLWQRRYLSKDSSSSSSSSSSLSSHDYDYYPHYEIRQTRWNDNDGFGHINNTVYYNFMDDAINMHLLDRGIGRDYPRFIAENGIQYKRPISFPATVKVGLRVVQLGTSSVTYNVGFFENKTSNNTDKDGKDEDEAMILAAQGKFVHIYVNEATGRPVPIPDEARQVLQLLQVDGDDEENDA